MSSVAIATANIFFSLILGAVALVFVSIQFPDFFAHILDFANWLEDKIGNTGLETRYNNWVRFLIGDEQLTFMIFTVATRILLALGVTGIRTAIRR